MPKRPVPKSVFYEDGKEGKVNNIDKIKKRIQSITELREELKAETQELEKFCESIPEGKTIAELVKIVENVSNDGGIAIYLDGSDHDDMLTFNAEWATGGPVYHYGGEMLQVSREDLDTEQVNLLSDILYSLGFFCSLNLYVPDEER